MGVCQYSNELGPYLDGELDAGRRTGLEVHLRECGDCDAELSELRGLSRILAAVGPFLSSQALGRFHNRISELEDDQDQAERTAYRILRITRVLTGIAACLLVAGSIWLVRSHQSAPASNPTQIADLTPSTGSAAPWEAAIQPEPPAPAAADSPAPADDPADWMIGGLVSSAPLAQSVPLGQGD